MFGRGYKEEKIIRVIFNTILVFGKTFEEVFSVRRITFISKQRVKC
jgi:hypothetical protein